MRSSNEKQNDGNKEFNSNKGLATYGGRLTCDLLLQVLPTRGRYMIVELLDGQNPGDIANSERVSRT